ncbi:glycosidase [Paeniglutamicibacter antarcticus]|uniref:Glycosidase n=2 Tax=Arthrobacter terrae TaxID=2935737 RepID=A0A931CVV8_9MICC|nr:glycosidase [Arthrobacter terrae]MBG0740858.1 glycosidase [Arthrobacter terrae]
MAAGAWRGEKPGAGEVLAEAIALVPFDTEEGKLLSGGVPRGHKNLTTATTKLVKAGWLVKGRSGWSLTDDGLRATVAFPDAQSLAVALAAGTPVPAEMPVPTAPANTAKAASSKPAGKATATKARATKTAAKPGTAAAPETPAAPEVPAAQNGPSAVELGPQPEAVAIVGDFGTALGAPGNWEPDYDEVQMKFDDTDRLWKLTAELPEGFYSYKATIDRSWEENYGAFGVRGGANHELHHRGGRITFRYDHGTKDVLTS